MRAAPRAIAAIAAVGGYAALYRLGLVSGSTPAERGRALPGDELITHLPPGWDKRFGAELDWLWTFCFTPAAGGCTRMLIRNRGFVKPLWLDLGYRAFVVPADQHHGHGHVRRPGQTTHGSWGTTADVNSADPESTTSSIS
jgi:hypothetical protein